MSRLLCFYLYSSVVQILISIFHFTVGPVILAGLYEHLPLPETHTKVVVTTCCPFVVGIMREFIKVVLVR